jgi:hypothetical protein
MKIQEVLRRYASFLLPHHEYRSLDRYVQPLSGGTVKAEIETRINRRKRATEPVRARRT